jgi:hypothetical protein
MLPPHLNVRIHTAVRVSIGVPVGVPVRLISVDCQMRPRGRFVLFIRAGVLSSHLGI